MCFVNYGPVLSNIDDKAGYASGHDHCVIDELLPQTVLREILSQS